MFFRPSARRVARRIHDKAPGVAAAVTAAVDAPAHIEKQLHDDSTLAITLVEIVAESLIRGVAAARGARFAQRVSRAYQRLSPPFGLLMIACAEGNSQGFEQSRAIAELIENASNFAECASVSELEEFIERFSERAHWAVQASIP